MSRYIDADKLIEFANNTKDKTIDANDIARFPVADVRENVKGEWIEEWGGYLKMYSKCSVCGYIPRYANVSIMPSSNTLLFCPNCGADMRGES